MAEVNFYGMPDTSSCCSAVYLRDRLWRDLTHWSESAQNGAKYWEKKDFEGLLPREVHLGLEVHEQVLLDHHRKADKHTNTNSKQAGGKDKQERLIEIHQTYPAIREANRAQNGYLLRLLEYICGHRRLQGEEAQEHHYSYDDVKNEVKQIERHLVTLNCSVLIRDKNTVAAIQSLGHHFIYAHIKALDDFFDEIVIIWVIDAYEHWLKV